MSQASTPLLAFFRPNLALAGTQQVLTYWNCAWTLCAQGMISVSLAHLELARSMYASLPEVWGKAKNSPFPVDAAHTMLGSAKEQVETATKEYRRVNDELLANMFGTAESLDEGFDVRKQSKSDPAVVTQLVGAVC